MMDFLVENADSCPKSMGRAVRSVGLLQVLIVDKTPWWTVRWIAHRIHSGCNGCHMIKLELTSTRPIECMVNLVGLIARLLVRIAVLLKAVDTVHDFWTSQTSEKVARKDQADVHHGSIKSEVTIRCQHACKASNAECPLQSLVR